MRAGPVIIGAVVVGGVGWLLLRPKGPKVGLPGDVTGQGLVVTSINAQFVAGGDIVSTIVWTHYDMPAEWVSAPDSFADIITSIGRMTDQGWQNYYTISVQSSVPKEGDTKTVSGRWDKLAVVQMPPGPAGIRCRIEAFTAGWQQVGISPEYFINNLVVIP